MKPKLINHPPNKENTIPYFQFQASSPERFMDDEKLILFAGGNNFQIVFQSEVLSNEIKHILSTVSLYILNTSVILFNDDEAKGLELPYQSIVLHAVKANALYLQISSHDLFLDHEEIIELNVIPSATANHDEVFRDISRSLEDIYRAMTHCSALNFDESSEISDVSDHGWDGWVMSGDGDDLDDIVEKDLKGAAMNIDVGFGPIAGHKRRESEDDGYHKKVKSRR
ncbi:protein Lot5p [[Candida] jaroonii]|uniref:Protein Lot5p n=1 Tax=[Candida] jaroonii TaxID=467808 RepID=A0ACA9YFS0_9ASCO|nr:protein Lot5p [[Candida] jaroonii]